MSRVQGGKATTDVLLSAHVGGNAEVFAGILRLHVPEGSVVADVTWGKGAFWRDVAPCAYDLRPTDIQTGTDARDLPYADGEIDAVVFDPPYMEGLFRKAAASMAGGGSHAAFRDRYSDGQATPTNGGPKYHAAVLDLYYRAAEEARRVLCDGGIYIVKCQDEVSANRQELTHVQIVNHLETLGFYARDLFVVVRNNRPGVSRMKTQVHARKNHSYFLVFGNVGVGRVATARSRSTSRADG